MSHVKTAMRTALLALTLFGAAAATSTMFQPTALTVADSSGGNDSYDAG